MRVAYSDMKNTSVNCPSNLTQYQLDTGERVCGTTNIFRVRCESVVFPTHRFSYQHVCGMAVGFSYFHPCAFFYSNYSHQNTINHAYVAGLSITYGPQNGRNHIWTYAGGYRKGTHMAVTVPVLLTQEPAHHHLWDRTSIASLLHATHLPDSDSPTTHSGMERTATQEAIVVTMLLLRGSGGHFRRIPQRT